MAPGTIKVTAFQKDYNPDTRTVINGIPFNIKNKMDGLTSEPVIFSSFNHFLLKVGVHIVEIVAVTCHPHYKIFVIRRAGLCCKQGSCINNIELNVMTTQCKITADEMPKFYDILFLFQQPGRKR